MDNKQKNAIKRKVKAYISSVEDFIRAKNNGTIPPEWSANLTMLEVYYHQFLSISEEIQNLDNLLVSSKYGQIPNPLLGARDKAALRIESISKAMGLTMASAAKLDIMEPQKEISVLDQFLQDNIEKR